MLTSLSRDFELRRVK